MLDLVNKCFWFCLTISKIEIPLSVSVCIFPNIDQYTLIKASALPVASSLSSMQPAAIQSIQRAWRHTVKAGLTTRQLVLGMDALRLRTKEAKGKNTALFFTRYLKRLVLICEHLLLDDTQQKKTAERPISVLILGIVLGSKLRKLAMSDTPTKRLWAAFESAHLHMLSHFVDGPSGPTVLLTRAHAVEFLLAVDVAVGAHQRLQAFKAEVVHASNAWLHSLFLQRIKSGAPSSDEAAFLKLRGCDLAKHVQAEHVKLSYGFLPLPSALEPIWDLERELTLGVQFDNEEAVAHELLLNPSLVLFHSLALDFSLVYKGIPRMMSSWIELHAGRVAMWKTIAKEIEFGVFDRASSIYMAVTGSPLVSPPTNVDTLQALLSAKERQLTLRANAFINKLRPLVLEQGPAYEANLFQLRLQSKAITLDGTTEWLKKVMGYLSPQMLSDLVCCDPLALKRAHALAIVCTIMYPDLRRLRSETLMHDIVRLEKLCVPMYALISALRAETWAKGSETVLMFLVGQAIGTSDDKNQALVMLDDWGLTPSVCDLVHLNAQVHWPIYERLLPLLAQEHVGSAVA